MLNKKKFPVKFLEFNKYPTILVSLFIFLFLNMACSTSDKNASNDEKPNIILVMIDNVGFPEIGINGNDLVRTPNLDRFASKGIQFARFYSNPMCAPTRASLMTGRYHYRTGVIHTSRGGAKMFGDELTIAELLKNEGYATGIFGKWHLGDNFPMRPQDQGFDELLIHKSGRLGQVPDAPNPYINPKLWENGEFVQKKGYCTDLFFEAANIFIEKNRNNPFFIYLPTNIAHTSKHVGLEVPEEYSAPYIARGLDKKVATVCGMLNNFDENFGGLIDKLNSLGLRDNTLVIFLSDDGNVRVNRGNLKGEGYASPYEGSLKVPCFIQWPGHFQEGARLDHIVSHIDILPTLMDVTGTNVPSNLQIDGVSLLSLLEGKVENWQDRTLFLQCHRGMTPHRYQNFAEITGDYKLIGYPNTFEERQLVTSTENPVLELYNIIDDPAETINLAERYPEVLEELKTEYNKWFDDVKSTRQFSPGVIHLGSDAENPAYLCRYQDATYINQKPTGWPVFIERQGNYEFTINRGGSLGKGELCVQLDSTYATQFLKQGENQAIFQLPEGKVHLNVWVNEEGESFVPRPDEDKIGDVIIKYLSEK